MVHFPVSMLSQNQSKPVILNVEEEKKRLISVIAAAKRGDADAFTLLYTTYITPLYRYIYSRTRDKDLTEDLCQNVFLRFYEALPRYELETVSPLSYLFTIAKRLMINHHEKKRFEHFGEGEEVSLTDHSNLEDEMHMSHLAGRIWEHIDTLPPLEQDVLRLYFTADLSHKEIAEVLDKEEAYIRKIKSRGLESLRTATHHLYE